MKIRRRGRKNHVTSCRCLVRCALFLWIAMLLLGAWVILYRSGAIQDADPPRRDPSLDRPASEPRDDTFVNRQALADASNLQLRRMQQQQQQNLRQARKPMRTSEHQGRNVTVDHDLHHRNNIKNGQQQKQLPAWMHDSRLQKEMHRNPLSSGHDDCEDFQHAFRQPQHGCDVNPDSLVPSCSFENLRIDTSKITSYLGGEPLEGTVLGRPEYPEFPKYDKGAFSTPVEPTLNIPDRQLNNLRYMGEVLHSMEYGQTIAENWNCVETWPGTTLFITRYEYANLYHTMTDWWNAYFSLPTPKDTPVNLVFLDAHAAGNLDVVWERLFAKPTFVQHLAGGGVCFERAVLIPVGYRSELFPRNDERPSCPNRELALAFSNHVLRAYGVNETPAKGTVLIIDRKPYIAHPRSSTDEGKRMLENLSELRDALEKDVKGITSVRLVRLELMSFEEQLRAIRSSSMVIGNHGAGLSHVMFMDPSASHLVELNAARQFFSYLSEWKGVRYESIETGKFPWLTQEDLENIKAVVSRIVRR